jgi:hypothetical protein
MQETVMSPTTSGVSILFADPTQPFPSRRELQQSDAICVDLDLCLDEDGSLGEACVSLIENAEANSIDVILAAKKVRFYEVPGLDDLSVTLLEKPEVGLTGVNLAAWVAGQLSRAMGLDDEVKRGLRPTKTLADSKPGEVSAIQLESDLSEEEEAEFLDFVSEDNNEDQVETQPVRTTKKYVAPKTTPIIARRAISRIGTAAVRAQGAAQVKAVKASKAPKVTIMKAAASKSMK